MTYGAKMDNENPSAQGQTTESAPQVPAVPPGVQQRFDEMTARIHQSEAERNQLRDQLVMQQQQIAQMLLASQNQNNQQPREPELPPDLDPNIAAGFKMLREQQIAFQRSIQEQQAQVTAQQQAFQRAQALQAALGKSAPAGLPPEIVRRAQELATNLAGTPAGQVLSPEDLLNFAIGEHARKQMASAPQQRNAQGQFIPYTAPLPAVPAGPAPSSSAAVDPILSDYGNMDLETAAKAALHWEKQLGAKTW